jgi:MFS family permease
VFENLGVTGFWANIDLMLFYGFGAFFALIGSSMSHRIDRHLLLGSWIVLGVVVLASLLFFHGVVFSLIISLLLGFSIGLGFPSVTAFLGNATDSGERGRVSGIIILITFILTFLGIAIMVLSSDLLVFIVFCVFLRSIGFFSLMLDRTQKTEVKAISWRIVISQKNFALYLLPWILFSVAAGLVDWSSSTLVAQQKLMSARDVGVLIGFVCTAVSGVVAGSLADRFGRKPPIVIALVLIGMSFALLGFAQIPQTIMLYYIVYGIAWGFLFTVYLTVSADISPPFSKEKFYALSTIVPLTIFMGSSSVLTFLGIEGISLSLVSPVLSAIIFLSIIPLWRAHETLPESKINARKLQEHLKKVEKLVKESNQ